MRIAQRIVVAVTVGVATAAVSAGSASAAVIHCGETVTTSIQVGNDINNCPGDGLIIGADNLRINLNDHHITASPGSSGVGIAFAGHNGVQLSGDTSANYIQGFQVGVLIDGDSNRVTQIKTSGNARAGVEITGNDSTLVDSLEDGDGVGAPDLTQSPPIADSVFVSGDGDGVSGDHADAGVDLAGNDDWVGGASVKSVRVEGLRDDVSDNFLGGTGGAPAVIVGRSDSGHGSMADSRDYIGYNEIFDGGVLVQGMRDVTVNANFQDDAQIGFEDFDSDGDIYQGNVAQQDSVGFILHGSDISLSDNNAGSRYFGSSEVNADGAGFIITGSHHVTSLYDTAFYEDSNYLPGSPFSCQDHRGPLTPGAVPCAQDGFEVIGSSNVVLRSDHAEHAAGSGLAWGQDLMAEQDGLSTATQEANTGGLVRSFDGENNHRYGIFVQGVVTDGGNDRAQSNLLGQCVGVLCRP